MELNAWTKNLRAVYDKAVSLYRGGKRNDASYFTDDEKSFLASVGLRPINVYDYAEDFVTYGEPDWETFLLIAAARRDHFLFEQKGLDNPPEIRADQLPPKRATLNGIPWLPRIIQKARCFLEGALNLTFPITRGDGMAATNIPNSAAASSQISISRDAPFSERIIPGLGGDVFASANKR